MTRSQRMRTGFIVSLCLLIAAAQAQIAPSQSTPQRVLSTYSPLEFDESLQAARELNRGLQRSECVWRRVIRHAPRDINVAKMVGDQRKQLEGSVLSPEQRQEQIESTRRTGERLAKGYETTSEIRLQWDGVRTRSEVVVADLLEPSPTVTYFDADYLLKIHRIDSSQPNDVAIVERRDAMRGALNQEVEGMGTLLNGTPLTSALKEAYVGLPQKTNERVVFPVYRRELQSSTLYMDRGDVRFTVAPDTGRILEIVEFQAGGLGIRRRIVPSGYRTYTSGIQMPDQIVVLRYENGNLHSTEEYTLLSAQVNEELDPKFLQGPLFFRRTLVTDARLDASYLYYFSSDRPLSLEKLEHLRLANITRDLAPLALILQLPLMVAVIQRRRRQAAKMASRA